MPFPFLRFVSFTSGALSHCLAQEWYSLLPASGHSPANLNACALSKCGGIVLSADPADLCNSYNHLRNGFLKRMIFLGTSSIAFVLLKCNIHYKIPKVHCT